MTPRKFFDLVETGELASNFSEKDLISYAAEIARQTFNVAGLIYRGVAYDTARRADEEIRALRAALAASQAEVERLKKPATRT
jgi:hypothetical protein